MCQNKICLIYQYFLFKADRLKENKKRSLDRLKQSKDLSADELSQIYRNVLYSDLFEEVAEDIFNMLRF